jgi:hypothetical protein
MASTPGSDDDDAANPERRPAGALGLRVSVRDRGGIGHPLVYRAAFQDIADIFPNDAVLVVATYPTHCEVVAARRYTALRPVVGGW